MTAPAAGEESFADFAVRVWPRLCDAGLALTGEEAEGRRLAWDALALVGSRWGHLHRDPAEVAEETMRELAAAIPEGGSGDNGPAPPEALTAAHVAALAGRGERSRRRRRTVTASVVLLGVAAAAGVALALLDRPTGQAVTDPEESARILAEAESDTSRYPLMWNPIGTTLTTGEPHYLRVGAASGDRIAVGSQVLFAEPSARGLTSAVEVYVGWRDSRGRVRRERPLFEVDVPFLGGRAPVPDAERVEVAVAGSPPADAPHVLVGTLPVTGLLRGVSVEPVGNGVWPEFRTSYWDVVPGHVLFWAVLPDAAAVEELTGLVFRDSAGELLERHEVRLPLDR